jgi:hypothetical protein
MTGKDKGGTKGMISFILSILSILIAGSSVGFTAAQMETTIEHNRFSETQDSLMMLYDRLLQYRAWVITLHEEYAIDTANAYYVEASSRFRQAEEELRERRNFDLARQWIGEAYVSLERGRETVEQLSAR